MLRLIAIALPALLFAAPLSAELRVFELQHATPEALLPSVQPLLGPHESVSAHRNTLIVNAGSGALQRIERLLGEIDRPLRNLVISLRRRGAARASAAGVGVAGSPQAGDAHISTTRETAGDSQRVVRTERRTETRAQGGAQAIRALEDSAVQIRDGQLVPLARGGTWGPWLDYVELEKGFAVSARVTGETVTLDVTARDERIETGSVIRSGGVSSTVSGALGEWIWLGGAQRSESARIDGPGTRYSTQTQGEDQYEIRVELSP